MHDKSSSPPIYSYLTIVAFLAAMVILVVTGHAKDSNLIIAIAVSSLPSLVASIAAEKASRDIRNGTVAEKARQGATQAIQETGVVVRDGPVATAQVDALRAILETIHSNTSRTAEQVDTLTEAIPEVVTPPDGTPKL